MKWKIAYNSILIDRNRKKRQKEIKNYLINKTHGKEIAKSFANPSINKTEYLFNPVLPAKTLGTPNITKSPKEL